MSADESLPGGYSIQNMSGWKERWREQTAKPDLRARSTDLLVYAWYENRRERCERWLLVEWDSYCACPVAEFFGELLERDFVGSAVNLPGDDWWWFRETKTLPDALREYAAGVTPFSFILVSDHAVSAMCRRLPDGDLGAGNGELRFASLARACGFHPLENRHGAGSNDWEPLPEGTPIERGMWHPVKWLVPRMAIEPTRKKEAPDFKTRTDIINWLIEQRGFSAYLEIGVGDGKSFAAIRCAHKESVDPAEGAYSEAAATHRMTSDVFFAQNTAKFDLIFIDGLHHADAVGRDLDNALAALNDGGMLVCHDLNPLSEAMQAVPRQVSEWTGDCWKAWVRLRCQRDDLIFAVADIDYGVGVIFTGAKPPTPKLAVNPDDLNWPGFVQNRREWLPLIPPGRLSEVLGLVPEENAGSPLVVVTLWRPEWTNTQQAVFDYLESEDFPERTHFVWTAETDSRAAGQLETQWRRLNERARNYTVELIETKPMPSGSALEKHTTVASLYNQALTGIESELVFSVEDDVIPFRGTWAKLCFTLASQPSAAAVMGAYRTRQRHDCVCAGDLSGKYLSWSVAGQREIIPASWVAAGLTLYRATALKKCLPAMPERARESWVKGWDMVVSQRLRARGDSLWMDAGCVAEHRYESGSKAE